MQKLIIVPIIITIIISLLSGCRKSDSNIDKTVVSALELDRYLGKWYEIARYENRFEKGLEKVTAEYSIRDDGKIKVLNSGLNIESGKRQVAVGKAKVPDTTQPAKLKVSFFAFFYADYLVLELDKDYKWAVVGSSSDDYLWILSRSTEIPDDLLNHILMKIAKRGYSTEKLKFINQK